MNLNESIQIALEGLAANKMRATLTMLGVIIGVGAVIAMLAIGQGAQEQTMRTIQSMGTNVMMVFPNQQRQGAVMGGVGSQQTMTLDDIEAIKKKCPLVKTAVPEVRQNMQVKFGNQNTNTSIMGTAPEYPSVRNYQVEEGRWFNEFEVKSSARVAVIGPETATNIFGKRDPVGKEILIAGSRFVVLGITASKGSGFGGSQDDIIFVPVTTAMRRLFGITNIRTIDVQARSMAESDAASDEVTRVLRKQHRLNKGEDDDFRIFKQADIVQMASETSAVFTMLLAGIASVSLLVGGIGIMNIMLVSVTERTREIGIRKALGARRQDIMMQFLIESLVLSLMGGTAGVLFGVGTSSLIGSLSGWNVSVSLNSVLLSFSFAAGVGIFFGLYPARQAARLNPIEALRYE